MRIMVSGLFLVACLPTKNSAEQSDEDISDSGLDEVLDIGATVEEAFRVPERPWDLAIHPDGRIFCSSQSGSKLYAWDPSTQLREEMTANFADIQALQFVENDIYYTTTQYGVTGSLSRMTEQQSEVLYTQADDGTLFRWPMDLLASPSGGWILADYEAGGLFLISSTGQVSFQTAGSNIPEALAFQHPYLYIGGEDGVFRQEWPNGNIEQIDDRPAHGLEIVEDQLWAGNSEQGVYIVGEGTLGFDQAARVGSLLWTGEHLYFADKVGEGIWKATW